ncbi:tetQ family GTPase, putative [Plasmodium reichenowi]|uniref:TetQ family GTPase, putative n=1 Tax=Plasmodium reichenowi TaxID=5854 RepID=A0A2P9DIH0_PLARE|nr:tetQ family GTPase, putative [Plasmodium reichenowi]
MFKRVCVYKNSFWKYKKRFFSKKLVNIGILAHIDAGKTTISEDILYQSKEIKVKGNINDQNTQLDFLKQERERGITIKSAYSCFEWHKIKVNLIDTPGHIDFSNETFISLCVLDKCIIVIDSKEGVQIQTINIFRYIKENLPIYFFLNKMDINHIDIDSNFLSIKNRLTKKGLLITYPIYENKKLKYILDIPSMVLYSYPQINYGQTFMYNSYFLKTLLEGSLYEKKLYSHFVMINPKPDTLSKENKNKNNINILNVLNDDIIDYIIKKREEIIEILCDLDYTIEYKYLNNIPISYEHFKNSLSLCIDKKYIFPIFSGSALHSYGVHILLDYITHDNEMEKGMKNGMEEENDVEMEKGMKNGMEEENDVEMEKEREMNHNKERTNNNTNETPFLSYEKINKDTYNIYQNKKCGNNSDMYHPYDTTYNHNNLIKNTDIIKNNIIFNNKKAFNSIYKTIIFIFKLANEKNGFNTFCKVFKGKLSKNTKLLNLRNKKTEIVKGIYKVKADRYITTNVLDTNDIGMVRGFENIILCDIICEKDDEKSSHNNNDFPSEDQMTHHNKQNNEYRHRNHIENTFNELYHKSYKEDEKNHALLEGTYSQNNLFIGHNDLPPFSDIYKLLKDEIPNKQWLYFLKSYKKRIGKNIIVCTCAIEPKEYKKEKDLKNILKQICLEDNSILVFTDKNNKLVIGSIGILNIEVIIDKIKNDYNIDIKTSPVEIIQKEYIQGYYENSIKKEMKVGSYISTIIVGFVIKEKDEFIDISSYVQNVLKHEKISHFLSSEERIQNNIYNNKYNNNKLNIPDNLDKGNNLLLYDDIRFEDNKKMYISTTNHDRQNYDEHDNINILDNMEIKAITEKDRKKNYLYNNLKLGNSKSMYDTKGVKNWVHKYNDSHDKIHLKDNIKDHPPHKQSIDDEPELLCDDDNDDDVDEYLLNFNYDTLFENSVTVHKDVLLYIDELKKMNKKKKNVYDNILNSCIISLKNCLSNGYHTNGNIINTEIIIKNLKIFDTSTTAVAKYACNHLYYEMIKKANIQIVNPLSLILIQTDEAYTGIIVKDLIQYRNGNIIQIMKNKESDFKLMKIYAIIPVKFTHNYSSILRSISSGHANFLMTFCGYKKC